MIVNLANRGKLGIDCKEKLRMTGEFDIDCIRRYNKKKILRNIV